MNTLPIRLNFYAFKNQDLCFTVYRQKFTNQAKQDGFYKSKLPTDNTNEKYEDYYITSTPTDGFERYLFLGDCNPHLTIKLIWDVFIYKVKQLLNEDQYIIKDTRFKKQIAFVIGKHPEGKEVIEFEPYFLKSEHKFGFLLDYSFFRDPGVPFSLRIQQLSLSMKNNRANIDFYNDKYDKIKVFEKNFLKLLFPIVIEHEKYDIEDKLYIINSRLLKTKSYVFKDGESSSQFQGLKKYNPLVCLTKEPLFIFVFERNQRDQANELYSALIGKSYSSTFPGMESMFGIKVNKNNVLSILVDSISKDHLAKVKPQLEEIIKKNPDKIYAGFFIINEHESSSQFDFSPYHYLKFIFTESGIPIQAVRFEKITGKDGLKWSIANIALGMFAKMGGIPWKVKPSNDNCLIFGIGSAHKINVDGSVKKYFAYSVSMDSSGVYKQIDVLGDSEDKNHYIEQLKNNIKSVIENTLSNEIEKCVIHLPFKIKKEEMECIKRGIHEISERFCHIHFQFIKINTANKFFGYAENNSKVPYESSYIQLSSNEFLIWFEGLQFGKELVNKRFGGPVHIEFLNTEDLSQEEKRKYLQDILNLSGANWRGFNAKLSPISIFYPSLIAKFISEFRQFAANEDLNISGFHAPWFL